MSQGSLVQQNHCRNGGYYRLSEWPPSHCTHKDDPALGGTGRCVVCKIWEMDILLYTQLRDLSWNIATGFEHPTKKNVENLEMVQRRSTRIIRSVDKHNLNGKLETIGLIFTTEAESPDYKANWVSVSKQVKEEYN